MSRTTGMRDKPFCGGLCLVFLSVACDFGGDRSLGSVIAKPELDGKLASGGSPADSNPSELPQAGATTIPGTQPNGSQCNLGAESKGCPEGQYCRTAPSCGSGSAVEVGSCSERPDVCPEPTGYEVVCGCDGKYYDSACLVAKAGVSLTYLSRCAPNPCILDTDCERFSDGCTALYGGGIEGAICFGSVCTCGGTLIIL